MANPPDPFDAARPWMEKAEHDLKTAEHTLNLSDDECPFDTVCFHAQQCVEKYLKALLVFTSIDFPRTHDLRILLQRAPDSARELLSSAEVIGLNRYSIEARYPGEWEAFTRQEAERAPTAARHVRGVVRLTLGIP